MRHLNTQTNHLKELLLENKLETFSGEIISKIKPTILITTKPLEYIEKSGEIEEKKETKKTHKNILGKLIDFFSFPREDSKKLHSYYRITKDTTDIGTSKFGGLPDVPENFKWPHFNNTPLAFLAQFNLKELGQLDSENLLPDKGILSFFYDEIGFPWGFDPEDSNGWKVFYYQETDNLTRFKEFNSLKETNTDFRQFYPCTLTFTPNISLPTLEALEPSNNFNDAEEESYLELRETFYESDTINKFFGYCHAIQNDEMEQECELVSRGVYLGNSENYKKAEHKDIIEHSKDWILLFQLDSDANAKMMWGDCGRLYFWIKKQDLKEKNFDKVWLILQCF